MINVPQSGPLSLLVSAAAARLADNLAVLGGPKDIPRNFPILGDPGVIITALAPAVEAGPGSLCFAVKADFLNQARQSGAAAVIVTPALAESLSAEALGGPPSSPSAYPAPSLVLCPEPRLLFAVILGLIGEKTLPAYAAGEPFFKDRSSVTIGPDVTFGPHSYIGAGVILGARVVVGPRVFIEDGVIVGDDVIVHTGVVLRWGVKIGHRCQIHAGSVIGEDGFGYNQVPSPESGRLIHYKNQHLGGVTIGDDVEIGALTCIDRGLINDTVIGPGTKIDNLVQVGHNCQIGRDCIIVSQVGMAGHTQVGDRAFLLGQVGLTHGSVIGEDAILAGQSGVLSRVPPGRRVWTGTPAQLQTDEYRSQLMVRRELPKWRRFFSLFKKGRSFDQIRTKMLEDDQDESPQNS
jgi:UDP-3-O-[3-hydroxymyristoyl] glucosamine N-acyltransferase